MKIQVEIKNVYGEDKIYPVCQNAKIFAELAGMKTLTQQSIAKVRQLGYQVELVSKNVLPWMSV